MNKKSLFYRIGFNTGIQFTGKVISVLLGFVTVAMLTRYLGTTGYGNFTLVFAYMSFFGIFADFGLQLAIVRELSQKSIEASKIYGTYFWIKLLLVAISTLIAIILLFFFPYSETLKFGILIGALAVGIGGLSGYGTAIFQSRVRLDLVTYIDLLTKIINVVFIIFFVFSKMNFYYIVSTVLIGNLAGLIATIVVLKKYINFNFNFDKVLAKKIIGWSIPIGLTSFFSLAYFKIDTIMLSVMRGSAEVGIYSLSYKILENILFLWGLYMASVYPVLSNLKGNEDGKKYMKVLKNSASFALIFSLPIIIIGFVFASKFVNIFGGIEFDKSVIPLKILLFSVPIFFINNLFYNLFLVEKKTLIILYGMGLTLIINFLLNLIFIPKGGYIAASYTTFISEFVLLSFYAVIAYFSRVILIKK